MKSNIPNMIFADVMTYRTEIETISREVEFGRPYEARCIVRPTPAQPVEYTWYFGDRVVSENNRLYLPDLNRRTVGEYTCTARPAYGGEGRAYGNATFTVRLKTSNEDHTGRFYHPTFTLIYRAKGAVIIIRVGKTPIFCRF